MKKISRIKIKPGMYLKDVDFHGVPGITRYSLMFWEEVKKRIDPKTVCKAEVLNINKHSGLCLRLITDEDIKIVFYGCNAGYGGEGPRGTEKILKDCGFSPKRVTEVVFSQETFVLRRRSGVRR